MLPAALIGLVMPTVTEVLDRLIPDKAEAAKAKLEMEAKIIDAMTQQNVAQAEILKIEAGSSDKFVSRARPAFMWICSFAFAYHFIIQPLLAFVCAMFGYTVALPAFDMESLYSVTMGMLGLAGMRSYDKAKGTSK
jgi:hypothetical protein